MLDPLLNQLDRDLVTARDNFEVRLTPKFLFFRWSSELLLSPKVPIKSFWTFFLCCSKMDFKSLIKETKQQLNPLAISLFNVASMTTSLIDQT